MLSMIFEAFVLRWSAFRRMISLRLNPARVMPTSLSPNPVIEPASLLYASALMLVAGMLGFIQSTWSLSRSASSTDGSRMRTAMRIVSRMLSPKSLSAWRASMMRSSR